MPLDELRAMVEEKDKAIIRLINERMKIIQDIASEKESLGLPVQIRYQADAVLSRAVTESTRLGIDPGPVKEIFSILIRMSEEIQSRRR